MTPSLPPPSQHDTDTPYLQAPWEVVEILRLIGWRLSQNDDLAGQLKKVLRDIRLILPFDAGMVILVQDKVARVVAAYGYEAFGNLGQDQLEGLPLPSYLDNGPLVHEVNTTQRALILSDTHVNPLWQNLPNTDWIRSVGIAPLIIHQQTVGRLVLEGASPNLLNNKNLPLLEVLARQIANAIENAQLLQQERHQREIAETLNEIALILLQNLEHQRDILTYVLEKVRKLIPYTAAGIWLEDYDGLFRVIAHTGYAERGLGEKVHALAFRQDEFYFKQAQTAFILADTHKAQDWQVVPDFEWVRSWACGIIRAGGRMIGQLCFDHEEVGFFKEEEHLKLLEVLSTQISLAVTNSNLLEAERKRRTEIETLQRVNSTLSASLRLPEVLSAILQAARDLFHFYDAFVYLYHEESDTLSFGMGLQYDGQMPTQPPVPRPHGLTRQVATEKRSIFVEDVLTHPLFSESAPTWSRPWKSIVGLPLVFSERVVGVMNITFATRRDFYDLDLSMLGTLVSQASIALENARLYDALQNHATLLEEAVQTRTAQLSHERAQLRAILEGIDEGVIFDSALRVQYANQTLWRMAGQDFSHLSNYSELLTALLTPTHDIPLLIHKLYRTVEKEGVFRQEVEMRSAQGPPFSAMLSCFAVKNLQNEAIGAVTLLRDISQEKALQAQRARFISNASHELRTPLANIQTRLYLIQKRPERALEHLRVVEHVVDQMSQLVAELLDLSRFEHGLIVLKKRPTILQNLLDEVIEIQSVEAQQKDITLQAVFPLEPIEVLLDPVRIRQVLTNLLSNALAHTSRGGTVTLSTTQDAEAVIVHVRDTGPGIPSEFQALIFQPFFRLQEGVMPGTGLGLTISREIIEAHGGTLSVDSTLGVGSTFSFRLPLHESPLHP
jgi:signal transduction histidine kinase/GTP-sensing pleiotropic transcriptional regulator CodY